MTDGSADAETGRKRILIFAYFFPPLGGAGVQRIVKLAKYLPREGWDPIIVTVRSRAYWMQDPTLAAELGARVRVIRTRGVTGLNLLRILAPKQAGRPGSVRASSANLRRLRRLAAWFVLPDSYRGWVPFATRAGARLLQRERCDAILTTSSPDSAHLIGLALARRFGVPWVADFRDPWTRRMSFDPPTEWHRHHHEALERNVLEAADLVTVTAEETRADILARVKELRADKTRVFTNGYDEDDFAPHAQVAPSPDVLQILHAGQLNPERPADPFLAGLQRFVEREPGARARIRVRFIGPHYARDLESARARGLADIVRFEGGRSHGEIVAEMLRSHVLLLVEQDSERGALILPGKIFEYLRARRPILGLLPRGAAWRLIEELGAGRCCRTRDTEGCAEAIGARFASFRRGEPADTGLSSERLARFERRAIAREFARALDSLSTPVGERCRPAGESRSAQ